MKKASVNTLKIVKSTEVRKRDGMNKALTQTQYYQGYKISYCAFWQESWLLFWPKYPGTNCKTMIPLKFSTLEEAKAYVRENDENPENTLMNFLQG